MNDSCVIDSRHMMLMCDVIHMKDISFLANNVTLRGRLYYPRSVDRTYPAILFIHGWTSEMKRSIQHAEALSARGYIIMLFDMHGHGESEGDRATGSIKDYLDECVTAYDYLQRSPGVDRSRISVVSNSFGACLGAILTSLRAVSDIVLRAPADYPDSVFEKPKSNASGDNFELPQWRSTPRGYTETFALRAVHNFTGRVLVIESERDDRIPHQTI